MFHDLLGFREGPNAKFVKQYADLRSTAVEAIGSWAADVRSGAYPEAEHAYAIEPAELAALRDQLG